MDVKVANKKYSKLAHDYELTFTPKTEVEICEAAQNFPKIELISLSKVRLSWVIVDLISIPQLVTLSKS